MSPIAMHESGHAAVYLLAGPQEAQVIELRADECSGLCRVRHRQTNAHAILAGYVCELRVLNGKDWRPTLDDLAANMHLKDVADAAAVVGLDGLPALWSETAALVDSVIDRIEAIASALCVAGTLTGADVDAIWRGQ